MRRTFPSVALISLVALSVNIWSPAQASPQVHTRPTLQSAPKPLTDNVYKGLAYLISQQKADGGWSQGEESQYMRSVGQVNGEQSNVADTCMAAMAVLRSGSFPNSGKYKDNMAKAVNFICASIEKSDNDSLFITEIRGTRVQTKLGQYVDTFLASSFLPEVKMKMPTKKENERLGAALDKLVHKIEANQAKDGQWVSSGWATVHSQALALEGLNKAKQAGVRVDDAVIARAEVNAKEQFDKKSGEFATKTSANVPLYAASATLGGLQSSINSHNALKPELERFAASPTASPEKRAKAQQQLRDFEKDERSQSEMVSSVSGKLGDDKFVQGFGCNGGEEFLSYKQISETLLASHSKEWADWDKKITTNINHVQQDDGSWMGHHCITSRTFCTAAALMVLMADRSPESEIANIASKDR